MQDLFSQVHFKEEFLFCSALQTITNASDILEKFHLSLNQKFCKDNVCGYCIDESPAMLGRKLEFQI